MHLNESIQLLCTFILQKTENKVIHYFYGMLHFVLTGKAESRRKTSQEVCHLVCNYNHHKVQYDITHRPEEDLYV